MLALKQKDTTPPKGWDFQVPDGPLIAANTFSDLVLEVFKYNVEHGIATDNLAAIVEDEICRRKAVRCAPPRPVANGGARSIGVADVWRFLVTMKEWVKNGGFVDQSEADRRAEICAGCSRNADVTDGSCWGCTNIFGLIEQVIGQRTTRVDHALKNCLVCGCLNRVSCWVPIDVLNKASGPLDFPRDTDGQGTPCWKRASQ